MYYFAGCFHCIYTYLDGVDVALRAELTEVCTSIDADHILQMVDMKGFAAALVGETRMLNYGGTIMTMVSILLCFTRAQRDGSWDLQLYAFKRMLPFLFRYDHVNYAMAGM